MTDTGPRPEDLHLDAAFAAWLARSSVYSLADAGRLALLALDYRSLADAGLVCPSTAKAFELLELTEADEDLSDPEHIGWDLLKILRPVPPTK